MQMDYTLRADGANWPAYRDRMVLTLAARALGDHLTNVEMPTSKSYPGAETGDAPMTATDRWEVDDARAMLYIANSIPDSVFIHVKGENAKDFWDNMVRTFEDRSHGIRLDLERTIYNQRCRENANVRTHFAKLNDLRKRHAAAGGSIPDGEYAQILLASLPPSYGPTVSSITVADGVCGKELDPVAVTGIITNKYDQILADAKSKTTQKDAVSSTAPKQKKGRNVAR